MKLSERWLREWVNPELSVAQLAEQLTMAGLEVDAITPVAGQFNQVIVAQVMSTDRHPEADRLTLCQVDTGADIRQIVCGAANVRAGLKVALAMSGAQLPNGLKIKESKLRGQLSQGMLCSTAELGIEENAEGIWELPVDAPLGVDIRQYLILDDAIVDIDLTPNRADCLSVLGIAREVAALNSLSLPPLTSETVKPQTDAKQNLNIIATDVCPHYSGRVIQNINPHAQTPLWLQEKLRRSGVRVINPVVDVLNFVMLELGQPMHAFDLKKIEGDIQVRYARAGESICLLDGQNIVLHDKLLIIADQHGPIALAGIMGGAESAVSDTTQHVFLESAFFSPVTIAGVARQFGLSSESAQRYERGVDPQLPIIALERATQLLQQIVGGDAGPISHRCQTEYLPKPATIQFQPEQVKRLTGVMLDEEDMQAMLQRLGMTVTRHTKHWDVMVPTYRFDIALNVDIVEEIIRLYGYANIQAEPSQYTSMQAGAINPQAQLETHFANFLSARGYCEAITYSFVDPVLQRALCPTWPALTLLNPISSELAEMRSSLWPGLLAAVVHNINRQQTALKFFETGTIFTLIDGKLVERPCIGGIVIGELGSLNWSEVTRKFDFYDVKGDIEALLASCHATQLTFHAAEHPGLHPGQSAQILLNQQPIGWIGTLHPRLLDELDLTDDIIVFELTIDALLNLPPPYYQRISKYPQTRRDLSLLVDVATPASAIEQVVRATVPSDCLKYLHVFDIYVGASIPAGKKSLAIALTLQNDNRTLIDNEINTIMDEIIKRLHHELNITLRMDN